MANNLSTKFVTSFSELYIRTSVMQDGEKADPSTWFTIAAATPAAKQFTVALTGTGFAADGVVSFVIQGSGIISDAIISVTSAATTLANLRTDLATKFLESPLVSGATVANGVITVVLETAAGDAVITVDEVVDAALIADVQKSVDFSSGTAGSTRLIPNVMEIGTLSNEATIIETPEFGAAFKGKLRGQLDAGQLDAQLYWAPRNSVHLAMREAATDGTKCSFGIKWMSDNSNTDAEYVVFDGFLSSFGIDTTFDDVAKASSTMIVDGELYFDQGV